MSENYHGMHLIYEVTLADYMAKLNRFIGVSAVGSRFTLFAYISIITLAWTAAILFYIKQSHLNTSYLFAGAFALFLTFSLPWLYKWYQNSFWNSVFTSEAISGLTGRKMLIIHDDFLEEIGEKLTIRVKWCDIQRLERDQNHLWIIISPLLIIVIPISAFQDSQDYVDFFSECERRKMASS
jgi:hypothetical protein